MQNKGIDWYQISKINIQNLNLYQFESIIKNADVYQGIDKVSIQYKVKLFQIFQQASSKMKKQSELLLIQTKQLSSKRDIVASNLKKIQNNAQESFKQINNYKIILEQKKRLLKKLKQKVLKKIKPKQKKIYCCITCNKQYENAQQLKLHSYKQHQQKRQNNSQVGNQVHELKDLLLTMKDKQMQMMSMFIKAGRQIQTQKLQTQYLSQYKKIMQKSNNKTQYQAQDQQKQLKGQSQFLFFPKKSQIINEQIQRDRHIKGKMAQQNYKNYQQQNNKYKKYYQIFHNMQENISQHIDADKNINKTYNIPLKNSYPQNTQEYSKIIKHLQIKTPNYNDKYNQTQRIQQNQSKINQKSFKIVTPSISDRLKQINNASMHNPKYDTLYSTKHKYFVENNYVFNAGPLLQDPGQGSDYQDYFGQNPIQDQSVQDQQIKLHLSRSNQSGHTEHQKSSFNLSKLLSPKQSQYSSYDKIGRQKSSDIIDLSDSLSKKDFQLSKDQSSINLSDLRISKLQKKKQQQKLRQQNEQKIKIFKKPVQKILIIPAEQNKNQRYIQLNKQKQNKTQQISILKQFQLPNTYIYKQQKKYNERQLYKYINQKSKPEIINKNEIDQNTNFRESILNQFMRKQILQDSKNKQVKQNKNEKQKQQLKQFYY